MFYQLSGHSLVQSSWHRKLTTVVVFQSSSKINGRIVYAHVNYILFLFLLKKLNLEKCLKTVWNVENVEKLYVFHSDLLILNFWHIFFICLIQFYLIDFFVVLVIEWCETLSGFTQNMHVGPPWLLLWAIFQCGSKWAHQAHWWLHSERICRYISLSLQPRPIHQISNPWAILTKLNTSKMVSALCS